MKEKQVLDTDNMKPDEPITGEPGSKQDEKTVSNDFGDNQFFGPWYSYKTTHTIAINNTPKNTVP